MSDVKDYPPYLDYPKPRKKRTNGDRIRSMTDEELAREINRRTDCEPWACPVFNGCLRHKSAGECQRKILDWLKQEAKDNA